MDHKARSWPTLLIGVRSSSTGCSSELGVDRFRDPWLSGKCVLPTPHSPGQCVDKRDQDGYCTAGYSHQAVLPEVRPDMAHQLECVLRRRKVATIQKYGRIADDIVEPLLTPIPTLTPPGSHQRTESVVHQDLSRFEDAPSMSTHQGRPCHVDLIHEQRFIESKTGDGIDSQQVATGDDGSNLAQWTACRGHGVMAVEPFPWPADRCDVDVSHREDRARVASFGMEIGVGVEDRGHCSLMEHGVLVEGEKPIDVTPILNQGEGNVERSGNPMVITQLDQFDVMETGQERADGCHVG